MPVDETAAVLFATLVTTLAYGIAVCLFVQSIVTILRKRWSTGQVSWVLVVPSTLIFLFASVVSSETVCPSPIADRTLQNVLALWVNFYWAILVSPEGAHYWLALVANPCKTAYQTGQEGAIMLADILIVSVHLAHLLSSPF
ncbi:hypothetical protein HWV62_35047 [Athelia sp. TMB]|nr:hypothetical protein HWV62_35047 [Athelia sp. TMB]